MSEPIPVLIPLINPNEREAFLASLVIRDGQTVQPGDLLATLETTKSTGELNAEGAGFIIGLRFQEGDTVKAGEVLCYLAASLDTPVPIPTPPAPAQDVTNAGMATPYIRTIPARLEHGGERPLPEGLRITQPALALAHQTAIDLSLLPTGPLITESYLRDWLARHGQVIEEPLAPAIQPLATSDPAAMIIYGGGGHGKSLVELVRVLNVYHLVGIIDDGLPIGQTILGLPVLGSGEKLAQLAAQGILLAVNAVGGIGNLSPRLAVFERLAQAGFSFPAVVHPTAYIEPSAQLAPGVQVFPHAYVGSDARIGFGAIVNTGAIISHDCVLGSYTNISPGARLAGAVHVGDRTLVGMGVAVNLEVEIGEGCRIGNNATVNSSLPAGSVVRSGTVWR